MTYYLILRYLHLRISYFNNVKLMKKFHLLLIVFSSLFISPIYSQIITENEAISSAEKAKKNPAVQDFSAPYTQLYFGAVIGFSSRELIENEGLFQKPLNERVNETAYTTLSYQFGFNHYLSKHFYLDAGLSFLKNGEQYNFTGTDSTFAYQSTYNYIAMPIHFNYVVGGKLKFHFGLGLTPQMFLKHNQEQQWTTATNSSKTNSISTKSNYNNFIISSTIQAGIKYQFKKQIGIYFLPEFRYQLNSTYLNTNAHKHFARVFGLQFGLTYNL